jgi:heat shock protein HslJ
MSTSLAGCSNNVDKTSADTLPGSWTVLAITDTQVINNSKVTLTFDVDNRLSGTASCNNIFSNYSLENNSLKIAAIGSTRKMCSPMLMKQESKLFKALKQVKRFQLNNGELTMYNQQGTLQLRAIKIDE